MFGEREVAGLPDPARRYLLGAIAPGAPLTRAARLTMRGEIRLGARWLGYRAEEVLAPERGFVWSARVAGVITGSDHVLDGEGGLDWRVLGLVPVVRASDPDVARSSAGRAGAEAVWLPTALLPSAGVRWRALDDHRASVGIRVGGVELDVTLTLGPDGRLRSVRFMRWGDPDATGTFGPHPFGMDVLAHGRFGPFTIPVAGRAGWFHGTERFDEGEFFRFHVTGMRLCERAGE